MLKGITVKTESIVVLSLLVTMLKESVTRVFMALMDKTSDLSQSMKTAQAATSSKRNHRATIAQLSNRGTATRKWQRSIPM